MKIFKTSQIKLLDSLTIKYEPITSINLMERAAIALYSWFAQNVATDNKIMVFCGNGNNGGDGVALARMLFICGYYIEVYFVESSHYSPDFAINLTRSQQIGIKAKPISNTSDFPNISANSITVDALFGSGLSRPITGIYASLVDHINASDARIIAIDIPSGLFGEENPNPNHNHIIEADMCLTLEQPKISFFLAENEQYIKKWIAIPIGISQQAKNEIDSIFSLTDYNSIENMLHERSTFAHKGSFGHLLIVAGSHGMLGAAQLCTSAALRSGVGLTSAHIPQCGVSIFQQNLPEAIVSADCNQNWFTHIDSIEKYTAICLGPGLGTANQTTIAVKNLLQKCDIPLLIDADGLNIIANNNEMWDLVPHNTIITPHPKEFDRLFGSCSCGYQRLQKAIEMAIKHKIVVILKGAYTQIVEPTGKVHFNPTGNPGMATGGSGDVLAGIIGGLLAQGYPATHAAIVGTFIHGYSGNLASEKFGQDALKSSDIINFVPNSFKRLNMNR